MNIVRVCYWFGERERVVTLPMDVNTVEEAEARLHPSIKAKPHTVEIVGES